MEQDKFFLTKAGYGRFKQELEQIRKTIEEKIKEDVPSPLSSELSAEYTSFQEDMAQLRSRIQELEAVLNNCELIDYDPKSHCQIVRVGCKVAIDKDGQQEELIIVGSLEADPRQNRISNQSPIGRALLGKRAGDEVKIGARIAQVYKIKKITYGV